MASFRQSVYLTIDGDGFEKSKKEANQNARDEGMEELENDFRYPNAIITPDEIGFSESDGSLNLSGTIYTDGSQKTELGYLSIDIVPDLDVVLDIIQFYMKKLGKLKTVLEATK